MLANNTTVFAAIAFEQFHRSGFLMACLAVRGRFDLTRDGALKPADEQALVLSDEYEAGPQDSQLLRTSDLIPFKPNTDISVIGYTYAPSGQQRDGWQFGISINNCQTILQCHGLRDWVRYDGKWRPGKIKPVDRVPLDYRFAAGSNYAEEMPNANGANPIGALIINRQRQPRADRIAMANIEHPGDPVTDPFTAYTPAGLSPLPPFWQERLQWAGTYNQAWLDEPEHRLPPDFDYRFYQSASRGMIWRGFMQGDERIQLLRLLPGGSNLAFHLPAIRLYAKAFWIDNRQVQMALNLDGVHIDVRKIKEPWRVDLTWRAWLPICPYFWKLELHQQHEQADCQTLLKVSERGPEV